MNTIILVGLVVFALVCACICLVRILKNDYSRSELHSMQTLLQSRNQLLEHKEMQVSDLQQRLTTKENELTACRHDNDALMTTVDTLREQLEKSGKTAATLQAELARTTERLEVAEREFQQRKRSIEELQKLSTEYFKNIANEIFKSQSAAFQDVSQQNLRQILDPLKDNIENFKKQVTEAYGNEARERFSLQNEIKNLMDLNRNISQEAQHLTRALRGDSKVQGDWGEMILERLLEMSGLQRNIHFQTQATTNPDGSRIQSEDGRQLRPDVVVYYPDDRCIVIDSKVSLTAYIDYVNAEPGNTVAIDEASKRHIISVKRHIAELADKRYQDLVGTKKLDFVMMFIPNEGAYMTTMKLQPDIWEEAYSKRVLLTSPTHLIAALRMLEQLWKQDAATKNVQEIARLSGAMLDKFSNVTTDIDNINKHLNAASAAYAQAKRRLSEGQGNIIVTAKKIVALGAKTSKAAEINRMEADDETATELPPQ